MKKLIITEKPSQIQDWIDGLKIKPTRHTFYQPKGKGYPVYWYESEDYVFCNAVGHLVTIKDVKDIIDKDKASWKLENLPYDLPSELPLKLTNAGTKRLFDNIKNQVIRDDIDEIIVATDPEREGLNIWRKIEKLLPEKSLKNKKITRAYPDGPAPEQWVASLKDRKEIKTYWKNFEESAIAREDYDFLVGINGTVGMTAAFGGFKNVINVGRVQTAVLKFIYDREKEIENFIPEDFSTVNLEVGTEDSENVILRFQEPKSDDGSRFSKEDADKLNSKLASVSDVEVSVEKRDTSVSPLKLYTQSTLAKEMNRKYGMSAKKVLSLTQSLYETHKLTSYPRTSVDTITEERAKKVDVMLSQSFGMESHVAKLKNKKVPDKYIFKGKVAEHEAITPVSVKSRDLNYVQTKLSKDEKRVYDAIVSRFVSIFMPNAEKEVTTVTVELEGHTFRARGEKLTSAGWMEADGIRNVSKELPNMIDGNKYPLIDTIKEDKQTTPPPRYNGSTILDQMMKPTANITDEDKEVLHSEDVSGIGTDATRANILDDLSKNGYVDIKGKNRVFHPTQKTMDLFDMMPENNLFSSPSATAIMETKLESIAQGNLTRSEFMDELNQQLNDFIDVLESSPKKSSKISNKESYGECPKCSAELYDNGKGISCPNNNWKDKSASTCDFQTVWKNKMKKDEIMTLISKQGEPAKDWGECPSCSNKLSDDGIKVLCSNCKFKPIYKNRFGHLLSDSDIETLLSGGEITVKATAKSGKPYELYLKLDLKTGAEITEPTWLRK